MRGIGIIGVLRGVSVFGAARDSPGGSFSEFLFLWARFSRFVLFFTEAAGATKELSTQIPPP
jgi:hypothetical protein